MEITEMKGLKPRQIKILQDAGVDTIEALAMSVPRDLEELEGISDKSAKKLVWDARDILHLTDFTQVSNLNDDHDFITTGSDNLNKILGGGIATGYITEVFGAFKSGKTNLSHTICVSTQLPVERGGLNGAVLFIDTENTFSKKKVARIAQRFGMDPTKALGRIYHARIFSCDHQMQMIKQAEAAIKNYGAKLIIVDSLMAMFRSEYVGIGMLAPRQQMLNKLIHELSRLAETYKIAVLLTNQVTTVMKGTFTSQEAIGGNIVAHGCHIRIQFKSSGFAANNSLERTATIVDAPDLPPDNANFFITPEGLSDTETVIYDTMEDTEGVPMPDSDLFVAAGATIEAAEEETEEDESPKKGGRFAKGKKGGKGSKVTPKKSLEEMEDLDPLAKVDALLS